jgi:hypothetical protein
MAEVAELDTAALMNQALADVGSSLRTPAPEAPPPPAAASPPVADVEEYAEPVMDEEADAPPPASPPPAPDWRQAWEQERRELAGKADLDAVTQRLTTFEQEQRTTQELLRALATQLQQPKPEPPPATASTPPITLTQASEAFYLHGDRSLLEQYERQEQARLQAQQRADQQRQQQDLVRTEQQKMLVTLANTYPFLRQSDGWQAMSAEYERLAQDPLTQATLPADPRYVVELGGKPVDLRLAAMASRTLKAHLDTMAAVAQQQATEQHTQERQQQRQQDPGVQGGTPQQQRPRPQARLLLPTAMVKGDNALLNHPEMRKAMQAAGWGNDPRTQAKHLAEKVSAAKKAEWQRAYQAGRHDEVTGAA